MNMSKNREKRRKEIRADVHGIGKKDSRYNKYKLVF